MLASAGRATLERWWEGTVLSQTADELVPTDLMADLMADLHEHGSAGRPSPTTRPPGS